MENLLEDRRKEISDGLEAASQSQRKLEEASKAVSYTHLRAHET